MKLLLQFVRYIEACVASPDWLDKFHSFLSASFLLGKESERFIFLGIFCNLLVHSFLNFQSRAGWLFYENNQMTKDKTLFQTFANAEGRGQFTVENSGCTIKLIEFCNITFLMRSFKDKII